MSTVELGTDVSISPLGFPTKRQLDQINRLVNGDRRLLPLTMKRFQSFQFGHRTNPTYISLNKKGEIVGFGMALVINDIDGIKWELRILANSSEITRLLEDALDEFVMEHIVPLYESRR